jgi:hypothetical protein
MGMAGLRDFVAALHSIASRSREAVIDMRYWGSVVDPLPQRSGEKLLRDGGAWLRVAKVGGIYGYLEAGAGDCRVAGVLVYGQSRSRFRASVVEGECGQLSALPRGIVEGER